MATPTLNKSAIRNEYEILFLTYHRNKNQHKSTTWFKHLNILVRQLRKLLVCKQTSIQQSIIKYLHCKVVPKLYYAFQGVIAQGQFITLGFVLVGSLAKVDALLVDAYDGEKKAAVAKVPVILQTAPVSSGYAVPTDQDLGEEVHLSALVKKKSNSEVSIKSELTVKEKKSSSGGLKRKSKAIDDIFGSSKKKKSKKKKSLIDDIFS